MIFIGYKAEIQGIPDDLLATCYFDTDVTENDWI
jgi:hypothetical protein